MMRIPQIDGKAYTRWSF